MEKQYLNLTYSLLYNPSLSSDEKLILAEIASLNKLRNGCIASDNHFAKLINKSRQTTNGIIKKLETRGFIILFVRPGIGKTTKLVENFWDLVNIPVKIDDTLEVIHEPGVVEIHDNPCRYSLQVGVENVETTCRETDTTNTSTITDLLIHEELQNTGSTDNILVENNDYQFQDACLRIIELINTDPEQLTNPFIIEFQYCCAALYEFFGWGFIDDCHIYKSNHELYEIYGSSNFFQVRKDLIFIRENMDRFLRQKTLI